MRRSYHRVASLLLVLILAAAAYALYERVVAPYAMKWRETYRSVRYPKEYSVRGIDVSHHQGRINWEKVQDATLGDAPVAFVFIKATEGEAFVDECFQHNYEQARLCGILRGAYHYFTPAASASKQARHFLRTVPLDEGDLPPVLDVEEMPEAWATARLCDSICTYLRIIEQNTGTKPIIYAPAKFYTQHLSACEPLRHYPLWVAHYYVGKPAISHPWKIWQHSDQARIPGIQTRVDVNVYDGSIYELQQTTIK